MSFLTKTLHLTRLKGVASASQAFTRFLNTVNTVPQSIKLPIGSTNVLSGLHRTLESPWIYRQQDEIRAPLLGYKRPIKLPNNVFWVPVIKEDPVSDKIIEEPTELPVIEKQAARLIVIRRKKMKKHKLRKLRKRMKFEWAKIRQKREMKKEKDFQAILIQQCKEAEKFSAAQYVEEKLAKLHEVVIPEAWKALPPEMLKKKMETLPKE